MTVHKITPPWERRADESDEAWAAFCHWRDVSIRRSLKRTCEAVNQPMSQVRAWHYRFEWDARARHYHKWQTQHKYAAKQSRVGEMHAQHANMAQQCMKIVGRKLEMAKDDDHLSEMTWKDVTALFRLCVEIERTAIGSSKVQRSAPYMADTDEETGENKVG